MIRAILERRNTFSEGVSFIPALAGAARGAFVTLCAGDDYWTDPRRLALQVNLLEEHPEAVACHHELCGVRDDVVCDCPMQLPGARRDLSSSELACGSIALPMSTCFRATAVDLAAPEFHKVINEDNLIFTQLAIRGGSIYMPEVMGVYRLHESSIWTSQSKAFRQAQLWNSYMWISRFHFRAGSRAIARHFAMRSGGKFIDRVSVCGPRVTAFALLGALRRWAKTALRLPSNR